ADRFHDLVLAFGAMAVDFGDIGAGFSRYGRCRAGLAVAVLRRTGDVGGLAGVARGRLRVVDGWKGLGRARWFSLGEVARRLGRGHRGGSVLGRLERNWLGGDRDR